MFYSFAADGVGGKITDPEHLAIFQQFYGPNGLKWKKLEDRQFLDIHDTRVVGKDIRITACPIIK